MHPDSRDPGGVRLLAFLGSGLVHGLGNALFAVQGHMQVLGTRGGDLQRDKQTVLASSQRAMELLELFRSVVGAGAVQDTPILAGPLLKRLHDLFRVSLRERGLALRVDHSSRDTPVAVVPSVFGRAVARTAQTLADAVPPGFAGSVFIDLRHQDPRAVSVRVGVNPEDGALPFPLDLDSALAELRPDLDRLRVICEPASRPGTVDLAIPASEGGVRAVPDSGPEM